LKFQHVTDSSAWSGTGIESLLAAVTALPITNDEGPDSSVRYLEEGVQAGSYTTFMRFYHDELLYCAYIEAVQVYGNLASVASTPLGTDDFRSPPPPPVGFTVADTGLRSIRLVWDGTEETARKLWWEAAGNRGKGAWRWGPIRELFHRRRMVDKTLGVGRFARETGMPVQTVYVRARQERWQEGARSRALVEAASPAGAERRYEERVMVTKKAAMGLLEDAIEGCRELVSRWRADPSTVGPVSLKQVVETLSRAVETCRTELKEPSTRVENEITLRVKMDLPPWASGPVASPGSFRVIEGDAKEAMDGGGATGGTDHRVSAVGAIRERGDSQAPGGGAGEGAGVGKVLLAAGGEANPQDGLAAQPAPGGDAEEPAGVRSGLRQPHAQAEPVDGVEAAQGEVSATERRAVGGASERAADEYSGGRGPDDLGGGDGGGP